MEILPVAGKVRFHLKHCRQSMLIIAFAGGESIYGQPFEDEFHSRLQFRRRALVACANENGKPNSNGSQFFFTLSRCDWLTKKHTIFGAITGDTVYNLMKFNDLEVPWRGINFCSTVAWYSC